MLSHSRIVVFCGMAEELDVGVAQLGDGAHAAAGTAAGQRVRGAGGHLKTRAAKSYKNASILEGYKCVATTIR